MPRVHVTDDKKSVTAGRSRPKKTKPVLSRKARAEVGRIAESKLDKRENRRQHYFALSPSSVPVPATAAWQLITNGLVHGSTDDDFVGNQIDPTGLTLRFRLHGNTSSGVPEIMRVMVAQFATRLTTPIMFGSAPVNALQSNSPMSFYNTDDVGKTIKILHDSRHVIDGNAGSSDHCQYLDVHIPGNVIKKLGYNVDTATWDSNPLYWGVCSLNGSNQPFVTMQGVLRYRTN